MFPYPAVKGPTAPSFTPVTEQRNGQTLEQSVPVPAGATTATIEAIGKGGSSSAYGGGGGAAYSKKNTFSLDGITSLYISIGKYNGNTNSDDPTSVRANSSTGTILCSADSGKYYGGGSASNSVGDVKYSGGNGSQDGNVPGDGSGGGAGGRTGNGTNAPGVYVAGTGNAPGGNGGVQSGAGQNWGGGAGGNIGSGGGGAIGGNGWVSIVFS